MQNLAHLSKSSRSGGNAKSTSSVIEKASLCVYNHQVSWFFIKFFLRKYASRRFNFVNQGPPDNCANKSSIFKRGYCFSSVALLTVNLVTTDSNSSILLSHRNSLSGPIWSSYRLKYPLQWGGQSLCQFSLYRCRDKGEL